MGGGKGVEFEWLCFEVERLFSGSDFESVRGVSACDEAGAVFPDGVEGLLLDGCIVEVLLRMFSDSGLKEEGFWIILEFLSVVVGFSVII